MTSRKIPESAVENLVSDLEGKANVSNTVTTDTNQTITGAKVFTTTLMRKSTVIDVTTQPENYIANNGFQFIDKNGKAIGYLENSQQAGGRIATAIHAKNKDNYQQSIGVLVPSSGTTGAYAIAPNTPDNAPANAIATVDYVKKLTSGLELMDVVFAPLGIDESKNKRRYLNGQVIIQEQFPAFTSAVKARMTTMANAFTTETNWQAEKTNSKFGQCGKFVVDDTAGTIRLPCVVNAQGLVDLTLIGGIKSESLPNITGVFTGDRIALSFATSGAFYNTTSVRRGNPSGSDANTAAVGFDASRSSSTYQNNAPVQQEAVQYPYCIVVNTGAEEADRPINNYQVNNVYSYGMSQYYKGTMNNNSWLKSAGQWNDGTVYTGMYNWLLEQMNTGVSGFVASTAAYTDYDFVINTANQTFRLPLLNGEESWVGNQTTVLSTADIVKNSPFQWTATKNGFIKFTCYKANTTQVVIARINGQALIHSGVATTTTTPRPGFWLKVRKGDTISISAESQTLSGVSIAFVPAVGNGSLYYYIGDTLQNAQLINVARIEEKLTDVNASSRGYVVESYHNGTDWYRIYSDGWCEQGGIVVTGSSPYTVNLLKTMRGISYHVLISLYGDTTNSQYWAAHCINKTTTSFQKNQYNNFFAPFEWEVKGYKA